MQGFTVTSFPSGTTETISYLNNHQYYLESVAEFIKVCSSIEYQKAESIKTTNSDEGSRMPEQTQKTTASSNWKTKNHYKCPL